MPKEAASGADKSCSVTPSRACSTLPWRTIWSLTCSATSMGMAKARPWKPPLRDQICALTPTTRPWASNSGPPELPGLMAASVWMKGTRPSPGSERPLALTMPWVAVCSKP